jgi:4-nitrophenyl phosphatase
MQLSKIALRVRAAKLLLVDWDGCIAQGRRLLPGAVGFLRRFEKTVSILSNNSTDLPATFCGRLRSCGIHIPHERIHLAGQAAIDYLAEGASGSRVFLLGSRKMRIYAARRGLTLVTRNPEVVLLLRDLRFNYLKLQSAANMLRQGAKLVVSNPDLTHPTDAGVAPETGALLAALCACVADVTPLVLGKPRRQIFERILLRSAVDPANALMIGDNPTTDIAGAAALGIPTILINPALGVTLGSIEASLSDQTRGDERAALDR